MSLCRSVEDELTRWYEDSSHKALLVTGARQVGKTFAVREFMYENVVRMYPLSLREFLVALGVREWGLEEALVFCSDNVQVDGSICFIPWYLLMFCRAVEETPLLVSW